jgi:hypothetical protein
VAPITAVATLPIPPLLWLCVCAEPADAWVLPLVVARVAELRRRLALLPLRLEPLRERPELLLPWRLLPL